MSRSQPQSNAAPPAGIEALPAALRFGAAHEVSCFGTDLTVTIGDATAAVVEASVAFDIAAVLATGDDALIDSAVATFDITSLAKHVRSARVLVGGKAVATHQLMQRDDAAAADRALLVAVLAGRVPRAKTLRVSIVLRTQCLESTAPEMAATPFCIMVPAGCVAPVLSCRVELSQPGLADRFHPDVGGASMAVSRPTAATCVFQPRGDDVMVLLRKGAPKRTLPAWVPAWFRGLPPWAMALLVILCAVSMMRQVLAA
jgi:hypothetical protein